MKVEEFQRLIDEVYGPKDRARGVEGTFLWFAEEVGELARALHREGKANLEAEFADVLAWLATLANMTGVDLQAAITEKYGAGCPRCQAAPCRCQEPPAPPHLASR